MTFAVGLASKINKKYIQNRYILLLAQTISFNDSWTDININQKHNGRTYIDNTPKTQRMKEYWLKAKCTTVERILTGLQKVQNCSARLIFKISKRTHVSPLLAKLHWLPIAQRINYKIFSLCYTFAELVWSPLPLRPFSFTAFLCWHPHLSNFNTKEKVPRAACFLQFRPCHLE